MTDQEVIDLHVYLLGRGPADAQAVAAFRQASPNLELGRRKIFESAAFQAYYTEVTDLAPRPQDQVTSNVARSLLELMAAPALPDASPANPRINHGFRLHYAKFDTARLALVVGSLEGVRIDDLLPLGSPQAAVLHVDPGFAGATPEVGSLEDGTMRFRLSAGPAEIAALLGRIGRNIDVLALLGAPGGQVWLDVLRPWLCGNLLIVLGPAKPDFHLHDIRVGIGDWPSSEPPVSWLGLTMFHVNGWYLPVIYDPPMPPPPPPDMSGLPKLAVAAIVKNEASCICNMLESVLPIASFVSVVDTGSTDDTMQLAKTCLELSGVPHEVRSLKADRFDFMRNRACQAVPAWCDWILMLDADEAMAAEDFAVLFDLIGSGGAEAYALPRYSYRDGTLTGEVMFYPDRQTRLFRHPRVSGLRYEGAVHERLVGADFGYPDLDASALGLSRGGPHIHHLVRRYRNAEQEARKQRFYRALQAKYTA